MSGKSGHPEAGPGEYPPEPADGAAKGMNFGMTGPHPERNNPPTAFDVKGLHHLLRGLPDDVLKQIPVMTPGRPLEEGAVYIDLHAPGTGEFRAVGGVEAGPDNWFVPKELVHYQVWNWLIGVTDSQRIGDIRPGFPATGPGARVSPVRARLPPAAGHRRPLTDAVRATRRNTLMGWSWRIGRIAGIDVYVHFTFLILLVWVAVEHYLPTGDPAAALAGLGFILVLFGIVVLHELGHALAARRYGIRTRDITLLPIGGVARLERMPDDPKQELVVALAGPAVNVLMAAGIYVGLVTGRGVSPWSESARAGGTFVDQLFYVNVSLALFNLIPAFPMDGGRVLRALLALRLDYLQATQVAARMGQGFALLLGVAGLFGGNPFLMFIALFVWMGAAEEARVSQLRSALDGIPVERAMTFDFRTLRPDDRLRRAVEHIRAGSQQDFPVVENARVVGVLTRTGLMAALSREGPEARVGDVMDRDFVTADPRDMLHTAFAKFRECDCHTLPVVEGDRLVGVLTMDRVAEVLMVEEALRGTSRRRPGRGARHDRPRHLPEPVV